MAKLTKVSGDEQLLSAEGGEVQVKVEDVAETVTVDLSCKHEDVQIEPTRLQLSEGEVGSAKITVPGGDRRHTIEARLAGDGEADEGARVAFSIRSLDSGAATLEGAASLATDLGNLGKIGDQALGRRVAEELRAILQAARNVEQKLLAREDAFPDSEVRQHLLDRVNSLIGKTS